MKNSSQKTESQQPASILIVDDDPYIRESLEDILGFEGYRCLLAKDGLEALQIVQNFSLDLVLLDLKLPRLNGMDVLKQSMALQPNVPVVIISGQGTIQLAVEATKLGAFDFL